MTTQILKCPSCGSVEVKEIGKSKYKCSHCNTEYIVGLDVKDSEYIIKHTEKALWEQTVEQIEKILYNLNEEVRKEYIDDMEVVHWSRELKKLIPDHFMANFYEIAVSNDRRALSEYIGNIDVKAQYGNIDEVLRFAIKLISTETMLAINNLIIRAYENKDIEKYGEWTDILQQESKKIDESVYDVTKQRDVFVAYKSEDMKDVEQLVDVLENEEGLECFVASRNLQHGKMSDYDKKLEQAMDSCKAIVFVSSRMSRKTGDARTKELPYILKKDTERAPAEYSARNEYKKIPKRYKKPRVEYVTEPYVNIAAEDYIKTFFDGYERVLKPNIRDVAKSIFEQFSTPIETEDTKEIITEPTNRSEVKFCLNCGAENPIKAKFCCECGDNAFAETREKYIASKAERETREKIQKEYAAKFEAERKERERIEQQLEEERERKAQEDAAKKAKENRNRMSLRDFRIVSKTLEEYKGNDSNVVIPNGVTGIGYSAFEGCNSLKNVEIPNTVEVIWDDAFSSCRNLQCVKMASSILEIKYQAFWGCNNLSNITYSGTKKEWKKITKGMDWNWGINKSCKVYCSDGKLNV